MGRPVLDDTGTGKDGRNMSDLWEERLPYALPALLVLAVFYGIYFAKVLAQKRRGIRTRQIGRRKEKSIHTDAACSSSGRNASA